MTSDLGGPFKSYGVTSAWGRELGDVTSDLWGLSRARGVTSDLVGPLRARGVTSD